MIPLRYFFIQTLKLLTCLSLTGLLIVGFAFNYSYLGGNRQDRAEMNATMSQLLHSSESDRFDR